MTFFNLLYCFYSHTRLCVSTLKVLKFGSDNEAIFAMFDGGHNNEVPKIMLEKMPDILKKELSDERSTDNYMKYALLSAHRYADTKMIRDFSPVIYS